MKTFSEFYQAVKVIAAGRYFAIEVGASSHGDVTWSAYIDGPGWTAGHHKQHPCDPKNQDSVLESLRDMKTAWVEPVPEPDPDPVGLEEVGVALV